MRTTRSGKAFGNMQQRVDELDTLEDDSMDEDMPDETQDWTLGWLCSWRR